MNTHDNINIKENFEKALEVIKIAQTFPANGEVHIVKCPICGNERKIVRSKINGHIHTFCANEDCVQLME